MCTFGCPDLFLIFKFDLDGQETKEKRKLLGWWAKALLPWIAATGTRQLQQQQQQQFTFGSGAKPSCGYISIYDNIPWLAGAIGAYLRVFIRLEDCLHLFWKLRALSSFVGRLSGDRATTIVRPCSTEQARLRTNCVKSLHCWRMNI